MKEIEIVAKSKGADGKEVATPGKCQQYANVAEAVKAMTEATVLNVINMHVKIRALDALRKGTTPSILKAFKSASPEAQARIMALLAKG